MSEILGIAPSAAREEGPTASSSGGGGAQAEAEGEAGLRTAPQSLEEYFRAKMGRGAVGA
jgi:hypothetical protein